jgi:hypothetical protein
MIGRFGRLAAAEKIERAGQCSSPRTRLDMDGFLSQSAQPSPLHHCCSIEMATRHLLTLRVFQGETRHHGKIHHLRRIYAECRRMTLVGGSGQQACNEDMRQQTEDMPPSRLGRVPE